MGAASGSGNHIALIPQKRKERGTGERLRQQRCVDTTKEDGTKAGRLDDNCSPRPPPLSTQSSTFHSIALPSAFNNHSTISPHHFYNTISYERTPV